MKSCSYRSAANRQPSALNPLYKRLQLRKVLLAEVTLLSQVALHPMTDSWTHQVVLFFLVPKDNIGINFCYVVDISSPNLCVGVLMLSTSEVTVHGNSSSNEVIKVRRGHQGGSYSSATSILVRTGDKHTDTHRGVIQGDSYLQAREREASEEIALSILIPNFQPLEL